MPNLENEKLNNDLIDVNRLFLASYLGQDNNEYFKLFEKSMATIKLNDSPITLMYEIPSREIVLINSDGQQVILDQEIMVEGHTILPTKKFANLQIVSVNKILKDAYESDIDSPIFAKMENTKEQVTAIECQEWVSDLISLYTDLYGDLSKEKKR